MSNFCDRLRSPAVAQQARSPDHPQAFTRTRELPRPTLIAALLSFRGGSVQNELDAFFEHLGARGAAALVADRALAEARSKLHMPALWALNDFLIEAVATHGHLHLFKGQAARLPAHALPGRTPPARSGAVPDGQ